MRISDWSSDVCSSDLLLRRALPAFVAQVGERFADRPREDHRRIVPRHIGLSARRPASRLAVLVRPCVPARRTDVYPAAHRKMIVEHRDLLMMAASDRSEKHTSEHQSLMRISYAVF